MSDDILDIAVDTTPCPRCQSRPGEVCRTKFGDPVSYVHSGRWHGVAAGFASGYQEAELGFLDALIDGDPWLQRRLNQRQAERGLA